MRGDSDSHSLSEDSQQYLTVREAARRMRVPVSTTYTWCRRGTRVGSTPVRLRHIRRGNCIFVPASAIAEFEVACTQAGLVNDIDHDGPTMNDAQSRAEFDALEEAARREGL